MYYLIISNRTGKYSLAPVSGSLLVGLFLKASGGLWLFRRRKVLSAQIAQQNQQTREEVITLSLINTRAGISTFHGFHFK